jgi:hypothetical protein
MLKSKVDIQYAYLLGIKNFNPEEVEGEAEQCVVTRKLVEMLRTLFQL